MMTLDDLKKRSEDAGNDDDDQTFYAGGDKSGMAVQGGVPGGARNGLVDEIMEQARSQMASGSDASGAVKAFSGKSKRLTDEDDPSDVYGKTKIHRDGEGDEDGDEEEMDVAVRTITFWSDGFTLEPVNTLRSFSDPRSVSLLSSIRSGLAPLHELGVLPGQAVEMRVVHRAEEAYAADKQEKVWKEVKGDEEKKEGKKKVKPFSGAGHRLGDLPSPTSTTTGPTCVPPTSSLAVSKGFDKAKPSTKIQFRLADGSKHTIQFNQDQTVGDIYQTVEDILGGRPVGALLTGRPPAPLPADRSMTLKEAGLEGSLVIQQPSS